MKEYVIIKEILMFKCLRCLHEWIPTGKLEPLVCPKCKSPYWKTTKKIKEEIQNE